MAKRFKKAKLDTGEPKLRYDFGMALPEVGRHAEAVSRFERAIQSDPADPFVHGTWVPRLTA